MRHHRFPSRGGVAGLFGRVIVALAVLASGLTTGSLGATASEAAMAALATDGRVILMRHTQTVPGVGDPDGYRLDDCASQRNLNDLGKTQARTFGADLKAAGLRIGRVLVSRWCRADDTARLVLEAAGQSDVARVTFPALDNVWDDRSRIDEQVRDIRAAIAAWRGPGHLLMVSHGVTIRPVVGRSTGQGGYFVLAPAGDGFEVLAEGRL